MIHYAVVGHHSRERHAVDLAAALNAELFMDNLTLGSTWNHLRALNWGATQTGHLVVLEDDAVPVPAFKRHVTTWVTRFPDRLISLYLGRDMRQHQAHIPVWIAQAQAEGRDWIEHPKLLHAVAYIIPTTTLTTLNLNPRKFAADEMLTTALPRRTSIIYPIESLTDHRDIPSVEYPPTHRNYNRHAWHLKQR